MALVGSFPFNSFLSGVLSCVVTVIHDVSLRIQVKKDNKEFKMDDRTDGWGSIGKEVKEKLGRLNTRQRSGTVTLMTKGFKHPLTLGTLPFRRRYLKFTIRIEHWFSNIHIRLNKTSNVVGEY